MTRNIVYRPKQGFGAAVAEWFRGELGRRAQRDIRASSLAERGLLEYDYIDELWRRHRSRARRPRASAMDLYNVSAWHDNWVAGRALT